MFADNEKDALSEVFQAIVAEVLAVIGLILLSRLVNGVARRSLNPDRFLITHEEFEPVKWFLRDWVRKQFRYQPTQAE